MSERFSVCLKINVGGIRESERCDNGLMQRTVDLHKQRSPVDTSFRFRKTDVEINHQIQESTGVDLIGDRVSNPFSRV